MSLHLLTFRQFELRFRNARRRHWNPYRHLTVSQARKRPTPNRSAPCLGAFLYERRSLLLKGGGSSACRSFTTSFKLGKSDYFLIVNAVPFHSVLVVFLP